MSGYQFFEQVHKNPQWGKIPFVFITGYEFLSEAEIKYGTAMGISGYLAKPIRAGDVLAAVEEKLTPAHCMAS
jgi:CheY-like chemotaxis protein